MWTDKEMEDGRQKYEMTEKKKKTFLSEGEQCNGMMITAMSYKVQKKEN